MLKHSPAPWNVCEPTEWPPDYDLSTWRIRQKWVIGTRPGDAIAFVTGDSPEQTEANAKLLRAAPELLEATAAMHTQVSSLLEYGPPLSPMVRTTLEAALSLASRAIDRAASGD